jgi:hypothetical protein
MQDKGQEVEVGVLLLTCSGQSSALFSRIIWIMALLWALSSMSVLWKSRVLDVSTLTRGTTLLLCILDFDNSFGVEYSNRPLFFLLWFLCLHCTPDAESSTSSSIWSIMHNSRTQALICYCQITIVICPMLSMLYIFNHILLPTSGNGANSLSCLIQLAWRPSDNWGHTFVHNPDIMLN